MYRYTYSSPVIIFFFRYHFSVCELILLCLLEVIVELLLHKSVMFGFKIKYTGVFNDVTIVCRYIY